MLYKAERIYRIALIQAQSVEGTYRHECSHLARRHRIPDLYLDSDRPCRHEPADLVQDRRYPPPPVVNQIGRFLWQITEPLLGPIRRLLNKLLGNLGGIDLSPLIAIVLLQFLSMFIIGSILIPLANGL